MPELNRLVLSESGYEPDEIPFLHTRNAPGATRTRDLLFRKQFLFQLRYESLVIVTGLEPASS